MQRLRHFISSYTSRKERSRTVRFMFPTVLSVTVIVSAAVLSGGDVSYVRIETANNVIEAGTRFTVDVYAYAHVPVNAVDVTLRFDAKAVEVLGINRGQSVLTIWTQDPVIENDKVVLRGGTFRKGFVDEHKIASIELKAKQTGQSSFKATDVVLLAGDGAGTPVSVAEAMNSMVNLYIYDENTSPESIGVDVNVKIVSDIDGDGKVTLKDVSVFMAAWHNKDKFYDFNGDGRMTFRDFSIILANFFF
jgi:archaellum component FlaF (FlaF/FlaG flagellin family)